MAMPYYIKIFSKGGELVMSDYSSIGYMLGGLGAFAIFLVLFAVAVYIVYALGTKKVLMYYNHKNTWMAFIPIANTIALVQCMKTDAQGNVAIFGKNIERKWFQWFPVLQFVVTYIPGVGSLLSTAIGVICLAHVYKDLLSRSNASDEDNTAIAWVSAFIGIVWLVLCYSKFNGRVVETTDGSNTVLN